MAAMVATDPSWDDYKPRWAFKLLAALSPTIALDAAWWEGEKNILRALADLSDEEIAQLHDAALERARRYLYTTFQDVWRTDVKRYVGVLSTKDIIARLRLETSEK